MRVGILSFEFPPVFDIGVVHFDFSAHLRQFADHDLRPAVAGIPHIFAVGRAEQEYFRGGQRLAHVAKGVADELRRMAQKQGMRTLREEAIDLVAQDITTTSEVIRSIYAI